MKSDDDRSFSGLNEVLARLTPAELATIGLAVKADKNAFLLCISNHIEIATKVNGYIGDALTTKFRWPVR